MVCDRCSKQADLTGAGVTDLQRAGAYGKHDDLPTSRTRIEDIKVGMMRVYERLRFGISQDERRELQAELDDLRGAWCEALDELGWYGEQSSGDLFSKPAALPEPVVDLDDPDLTMKNLVELSGQDPKVYSEETKGRGKHANKRYRRFSLSVPVRKDGRLYRSATTGGPVEDLESLKVTEIDWSLGVRTEEQETMDLHAEYRREVEMLSPSSVKRVNQAFSAVMDLPWMKQREQQDTTRTKIWLTLSSALQASRKKGTFRKRIIGFNTDIAFYTVLGDATDFPQAMSEFVQRVERVEG